MRLLFFILFVLISSNLSAQNSADSCKCCDEKHQQFNFWIGDWEVKDAAGILLGYNKIVPVEKGCGLQENWTGAKGTTGTSISFYNRNKNEWHQSWVDMNGGVIIMNGQFEDGAMVLYSNKKENKDGDSFIQNRTTWKPLDDGRVKHVWDQTRDGGITWKTVFEGFYTNQKK